MPVLIPIQHRLYRDRTVFLRHVLDTVRPAETDPRGRTEPGTQGRTPAMAMLGEHRGRTSGLPGHTGIRRGGHPAPEVCSPEGNGDVFAGQPRIPTTAATEHD